MASRSIFPKHLPFLIRTPKVSSCESFSHPSLACFSTHIVGDSPILVRDFIRSALYDPNHGYFSQRSGSVGVLERSIKFNQLQGRKAYMQHLHSIYKQNDISWFTPVELFKPWYAHGIAEAIMRTANLSVPLKIYEIGGGSGTCAKGIMDYIMLNAPTRVYNNMTYMKCGPTTMLGYYAGENQVLPWMEVWVEKQHDRSELAELYKPLQDPLIISCMEILDLDKDLTTRGGRTTSTARNIWAKIFPKPRRCWLPTGCLKLLEVLHGALPKMSLIASDFSFLPDVKVPGERAPLVSTKKDGSSSDFNSYLNAKGDADIFFPTDFWLLERIDHYCSGWLKLQKDKSSNKGKKRRTIMLDTSSFMEEFGLPSKTRTKDGYNPLLDDFKNTKIYLSVPTHNTK
ncbi:uncharacterized protein LOC114295081 isoform X2 [Camellia sinensis]|uniref:uncharacterized protein LOC114295081 isoform X2 n=1 Tax=Camellia sinensis TaxID=4442 RepID=UPI0010361FF8|nr:uncharacterized protein LOC114295081 isoform X2 [Camellia sinensis]